MLILVQIKLDEVSNASRIFGGIRKNSSRSSVIYSLKMLEVIRGAQAPLPAGGNSESKLPSGSE